MIPETIISRNEIAFLRPMPDLGLTGSLVEILGPVSDSSPCLRCREIGSDLVRHLFPSELLRTVPIPHVGDVVSVMFNGEPTEALVTFVPSETMFSAEIETFDDAGRYCRFHANLRNDSILSAG